MIDDGVACWRLLGVRWRVNAAGVPLHAAVAHGRSAAKSWALRAIACLCSAAHQISNLMFISGIVLVRNAAPTVEAWERRRDRGESGGEGEAAAVQCSSCGAAALHAMRSRASRATQRVRARSQGGS